MTTTAKDSGTKSGADDDATRPLASRGWLLVHVTAPGNHVLGLKNSCRTTNRIKVGVFNANIGARGGTRRLLQTLSVLQVLQVFLTCSFL